MRKNEKQVKNGKVEEKGKSEQLKCIFRTVKFLVTKCINLCEGAARNTIHTVNIFDSKERNTATRIRGSGVWHPAVSVEPGQLPAGRPDSGAVTVT